MPTPIHVRHQVRAAAVTALTGLGLNVFASRDGRIKPGEYPALCVYTTEETVTASDKQGGQRRDMVLVVEGHALGKDDLDAALDAIAAKVETALFSEWTLGGLAVGLVLESTRIGLVAEDDHGRPLEPKIGLIRLNFTVIVNTVEGSPCAVAT